MQVAKRRDRHRRGGDRAKEDEREDSKQRHLRQTAGQSVGRAWQEAARQPHSACERGRPRRQAADGRHRRLAVHSRRDGRASRVGRREEHAGDPARPRRLHDGQVPRGKAARPQTESLQARLRAAGVRQADRRGGQQSLGSLQGRLEAADRLDPQGKLD